MSRRRSGKIRLPGEENYWTGYYFRGDDALHTASTLRWASDVLKQYDDNALAGAFARRLCQIADELETCYDDALPSRHEKVS